MNRKQYISASSSGPGKTTDHPSFSEAFRFWLKLGFISFGGPTGQIAIMQAELVDKKRWISQSRFLHALNFCMLLPGPEAQQLAVYVGWLLHKTWGGIVAGSLFVIPSMLILWMLSFVYAAYGNIQWIAAVFYGLKPAVMAIVAFAVLRIGKKALRNWEMWGIAASAFIGIFFFKLPFPLIVVSAGILGSVLGKIFQKRFAALAGHGSENGEAKSVLNDDLKSPDHAQPSLARALKICCIGLLLWLAPIVFAGYFLGWDQTPAREGIFFAKAAVVTFGGAYAVLPYVAQQAVEKYHWLNASQMMDGLGLAETTPGPLIMVLQFVGFMGGWSKPGGLPPIVAATICSFITTWATFIPSFLWIFLGGPHIERLRGNVKLSNALSAITAAIVGIVLNLAVWFGLHVLFPTANMIDWFALIMSVGAFIGMSKWNWQVVPVVVGSGLLGLLYKIIIPM